MTQEIGLFNSHLGYIPNENQRKRYNLSLSSPSGFSEKTYKSLRLLKKKKEKGLLFLEHFEELCNILKSEFCKV